MRQSEALDLIRHRYKEQNNHDLKTQQQIIDDYTIQVLRLTLGNKTQAAVLLNISVRTVRLHVQRMQRERGVDFIDLIREGLT